MLDTSPRMHSLLATNQGDIRVQHPRSTKVDCLASALASSMSFDMLLTQYATAVASASKRKPLALCWDMVPGSVSLTTQGRCEGMK